MAGFVFYLTPKDIGPLHQWLNDEPVVWIVCDAIEGGYYHWRTSETLEFLGPGRYCLWHPETSPLFIPSGEIDVENTAIVNPHHGWRQSTSQGGRSNPQSTPWFGSGHTGTFTLDLRFRGKEKEDSIARSEFQWLGDHFRSIGKPAHPIAKKWYGKLLRFVKKQAIGIPWPPERAKVGVVKNGAYAFPHAYTDFVAGRHLDTDLTWGPFA